MAASASWASRASQPGGCCCGLAPSAPSLAAPLGPSCSDVSRNSLTGGLPPEWGAMGFLAQLDTSSNYLSGSLPDAWKALTSLEQLRLASNNLGVRQGWGTCPTRRRPQPTLRVTSACTRSAHRHRPVWLPPAGPHPLLLGPPAFAGRAGPWRQCGRVWWAAGLAGEHAGRAGCHQRGAELHHGGHVWPPGGHRVG